MAINIDDLVIDKILGIELISEALCSDGNIHKIKMGYVNFNDMNFELCREACGKSKAKIEFEYKKSEYQEI